jgi:hypothetical protein
MRSAVSEGGGNASLAKRLERLEDRVSGAIWNPKGLRRSIGL